MTDNLAMFIPLTKVDVEKREVWGRATQEVWDAHDEIMDYDSSKPFFGKWSDVTKLRSQGKSKGNLREMHQPSAAGKLIAIDFNDTEKAVDIGTYVSDDQAWRKVLDGTYTGFSVGGNYARRWSDMGKTRYTADPHEISLVDAPAVPTATFEMIKADGTMELRKFADRNGAPETASIEVPQGEPVAATTVHNHFYGEVVIAGEKMQKFDNIEAQIPDGNLATPPIPGTNAMGEVEVEQGNTEGATLPSEPALEEYETNAVIKEITPGATSGVVEMHLEDGSTIKHASDPMIDKADIELTEPFHIAAQTVAKAGGNENAEPNTSTPPPWMAELQKLAATFATSVEKMDELRKAEAEKSQKAITELEQRGLRVGIARREGEPLYAPDGLPADWLLYADPANWRHPVTKKSAVPVVAAYNRGEQKERYSPTEWMILGRRITRMASSVSGLLFKFSPASKQVEAIQEKIMTATLNKSADPMGLLRDVSKQLSDACALIASDPSNAEAMLTRVLGLIDVASDVSPASADSRKSPPLDNMAKAADTMEECAKCGKSIAKGVATCEHCGTELQKVDTAPTLAEAVEPAVAKTEGDDEMNELDKAALEKAQTDATAAQAQIAALTELLTKQSEVMTTMQSTMDAFAKSRSNEVVLPAGDLQSVAQMNEDDNPLLKALNEGNLAKAFETVGNDSNKLYEQVNELAVQQLAIAGINVSRYGYFPANTPE